MCAAMVKNVSGYFKTGNKVYPTRIEVNLQKAKISFSVVSCDFCNGVDPPTSMKGQVVFQFPKGYLEKADAGTEENAIGQVFSIGYDTQARSRDNRSRSSQRNRSKPNPIRRRFSWDRARMKCKQRWASRKDCEPRSQAALRVQGSKDHIWKWESFGRTVATKNRRPQSRSRGAQRRPGRETGEVTALSSAEEIA
jgi:hypothetical protein